jgi:daunorubicin resistance ABC transporter membrane protein
VSVAEFALQEAAAVRVLWLRDLMRFLRQPSRIVGALGQPIIFWFVIGSGMAQTFRMPGAEHVGYLEYFFPGVLLMVVLFASIFATVSVIEDRHAGFLQAVLVAPGSRAALVLGKSAGAATVALLQAGVFLLLAPLAGFHYGQIAWLPLAVGLACASLGLTAFGFALAWWLDNIAAYHAIQMTLLVPLWVLSGAMFPLAAADRHPGFAAAMRANPLTYATAVVRRALYGGAVPGAATPSMSVALGVTVGFAAAACALAAFVCYLRR